MIDQQPCVSVLMPVYNSERYLEDAVESILGQSFRDFEFIIINDGSTDNCGAILTRYEQADKRIRLYHQQNMGYVAALNKALELARGKYIARMDNDDISLPERLDRQVSILDGCRDIVIIGSAYILINDVGTVLRIDSPPVSDTGIRWETLFYCSFSHPSIMLRSDVLQQNGLRYDEAYMPAEDYHLWSQMLRYGRGVNISAPLIKRRVHSRQTSNIRAVEQEANAVRVSMENIRNVGIDISELEVRTLRTWYNDFPRRLGEGDIPVCRLLMKIMGRLEQRDRVEREVIREIRRLWIRRILLCSSFTQKESWTSGLMISMLRADPVVVLSHVRRLAGYRIRSLSQKRAH